MKFRALKETKGAAWFFVGSVIQKIAPFVVMMIMTRAVSTDQYGEYVVFISWLELFEIIITMRIYSNGLVNGLVRAERKKETVISTAQITSVILGLRWFILFGLFNSLLAEMTRVRSHLLIMIPLSAVLSASFNIWATKTRVENNYRKTALASVFYTFTGPVIGALAVFLPMDDKVTAVVGLRLVVQALCALPFFISNLKYKISSDLIKDIIKFNIPLLPYYLSMVILNHADRIMIQYYYDNTAAAVYSVAYSCSMLMFVVSGAYNLVLQPWLMKKLKEGSFEEDYKIIDNALAVIVALSVIFVFVAPVIIMIIGGKTYLSAETVVPPLVASIIVMFLYQQYINSLFYFKRTGHILFISVFCAAVNVVLNALLLPLAGANVAGYTTYASYVLVFGLCCLFAIRECKGNGVNWKNLFNLRLHVTVTIALSLLVMASMIFMRTQNNVEDPEKVTVLYPESNVELPLLSGERQFTCTGLDYDNKEQTFVIGYCGKEKPEDDKFEAEIVTVSADFSKIISELKAFENNPKLKDIQGVALEKDGIWYCSFGENRIRKVDNLGQTISELEVKKPSGVAVDPEDGSLWVLTDESLVNMAKDGLIIKTFKVKIAGQDQIFLDKDNSCMYISAGDDYEKNQFVYVFDMSEESFKCKYILNGSYAIEGIYIMDGKLIVLNDGYYHRAKEAQNTVKIYSIGNGD
ncbi:MAG: oligosaccharide flippase family protein [Butyrivibrio sp.]|nr:oligosaccharide flippase family protein [Butyrivibrio sp.]